MTIRSKVDTELTRHVGRWFTVRQIQNKLKINPSTLKPLIMKYAREKLLKRRHIKGTARSVEFSPAAGSTTAFKQLLNSNMPYRNFLSSGRKPMARKAAPKKTAAPAPKKMTGKKAAPKKSKRK